MIVFDLQCRGAGHVFEAWFANSGAFEDQQVSGLLICPLCDDADIKKAPMTPNLSAKSNQSLTPQSTEVASHDTRTRALTTAQTKNILAELAKAQASALVSSTWVGHHFDDKARAMDAGEVPKTPIHGHATIKQAKALIEDGINIMPLPFSIIPPNQQN